MRIVYWGTYDLGKPRNRILIAGLRGAGHEVVECRASVWDGVEDKSGLSGLLTWSLVAARWALAYPLLIVRYLAAPAHETVIVGYMGQLDVLVLWPFAKLRGVPVVWDAFLSLYDTVVEDRRLVSRRHPFARALMQLEKLACRLADRVLLDTRAHADYFADTFGLSRQKLDSIPVGAEPDMFPPRPPSVIGDRRKSAPIRVLFYGQFIPLHGIDTIVEAGRRMKDEPVDWVLIGSGQEAPAIRARLAEDPVPRLTWIPWVAYSDLHRHIHEADVCLGIFGTTPKASRVIPNKVYQVLATGTPLITRDSPAMREISDGTEPGLWLVPPGDPEAVRNAVLAFSEQRAALLGQALHRRLAREVAPDAIGNRLAASLLRLNGRARAAERLGCEL